MKVVNSSCAKQKHLFLLHPHIHLVRCDHLISQVRKLRLEEVGELVTVAQLVDDRFSTQRPSFFSSTGVLLRKGGSCSGQPVLVKSTL